MGPRWDEDDADVTSAGIPAGGYEPSAGAAGRSTCDQPSAGGNTDHGWCKCHGGSGGVGHGGGEGRVCGVGGEVQSERVSFFVSHFPSKHIRRLAKHDEDQYGMLEMGIRLSEPRRDATDTGSDEQNTPGGGVSVGLSVRKTSSCNK